jgi:hypothetical protein
VIFEKFLTPHELGSEKQHLSHDSMYIQFLVLNRPYSLSSFLISKIIEKYVRKISEENIASFEI